ncbi:MAG: hypothetical protein K6G79_09420 [Bacteroidales bacterium]|nr:hypothetical protein [Bacteroidales bacterium]
MERAFRHMIRFIVAATYVFAISGFGIHTCHEDGSRHFVWMLGDVSCETIHHHSHGEDHDHHHGHGCCHTEVCVVSDAQDSDSGSDRSADTPDNGMPMTLETPCFAQVIPGHPAPTASHAPPLPEKTSISLISVWRI